VPALKSIAQSGHEIVAVYTQPPRPKGRGQHLQKSPVHACADGLGLPVYHPQSFKKDPAACAEFAALGADVAVVAAYGLILPKVVLEAPRYGCINIHASLLPRWRGASPIQRAVWAGDASSGITIMQMEEGLDTGPMMASCAVALDRTTTAVQLHDTLSDLGGEMIVPVLDQLGQLEKTPQDDLLSVYAPLLKKDDGRVDWAQNCESIDC
jgi:methionyl-tRNA formyltransferase